MRTYKINTVAWIIVFFLTIINFSVFPNNVKQEDQRIIEFTSVLKQKVLLTEQQSVKVTEILSGLFVNINSNPNEKNSLIKDAQNKVENLLDSKQKLKYDIIKNDLWKKLSL